MPAFVWQALDARGKRHRGVTEAGSAAALRQQLRARNLTPLRMAEKSASKPRAFFDFASLHAHRPSLRAGEVGLLLRQMASLSAGGVPVERMLAALQNQHARPALKGILSGMRALVLEGRSFAEAMRAFPESFGEVLPAAVAAAERSGHLARVLERLASFGEQAAEARRKLLLMLLYPAIFSVVSILIVIALLVFVLPDLTQTLISEGHALPFLTRALIALERGVLRYGWLAFPAALLLLAFARRRLARPGARERLDARLIRLPVIGPILRAQGTAQFASTLGMLHDGGVPLAQGLEITSALLGNRALRREAESVSASIVQGAGLAPALAEATLFTPLLATFVASGEASGHLGDMLARAGDLAQSDARQRSAVLTGLFEPCIILVMAGVVLLLVLAVILPMLTLNQMVH
jgi:general secretion pathway protein F